MIIRDGLIIYNILSIIISLINLNYQQISLIR